MPQKFPGVPGPELAAAAAAPYADGIEVTGATEGGRHTYPAARQGSSLRLRRASAFQIAAELLADARRVAMMEPKALEREGDHGVER